MSDRATLKIQPKTRKRLKVFCAKNDYNYDEGINHLLDVEEDVDE